MLTSVILSVVLILFAIFFIIYKRKMLMAMFSMEADVPTAKLQAELQQTADNIILVLEEKIAQLEELLVEADNKIDILSKQLAKVQAAPNTPAAQTAEEKVSANIMSSPKHVDIVAKPDIDDFAKQLILASANLEEKDLSNNYKAPIDKTINQSDVQHNTKSKHSNSNNNNTENLAANKNLLADDNSKHSLILAMAEQGYSPLEIAKATGAGKGEILLVLQLNKK